MGQFVFRLSYISSFLFYLFTFITAQRSVGNVQGFLVYNTASKQMQRQKILIQRYSYSHSYKQIESYSCIRNIKRKHMLCVCM